jgi:hypothetical protein
MTVGLSIAPVLIAVVQLQQSQSTPSELRREMIATVFAFARQLPQADCVVPALASVRHREKTRPR